MGCFVLTRGVELGVVVCLGAFGLVWVLLRYFVPHFDFLVE